MRGAGSKKSHSMNFALFTHWLHTDLGLELALGGPTDFQECSSYRVHTDIKRGTALAAPAGGIKRRQRQYTHTKRMTKPCVLLTTLEGNRNRNRTRRRAHHIGYYWDWERGTEKKRELKGVTGKTKTGFVSLFFLARNWTGVLMVLGGRGLG